MLGQRVIFPNEPAKQRTILQIVRFLLQQETNSISQLKYDITICAAGPLYVYKFSVNFCSILTVFHSFG